MFNKISINLKIKKINSKNQIIKYLIINHQTNVKIFLIFQILFRVKQIIIFLII
jgi:hypothetical protein